MKWIKAKDRLPEGNATVLAWTNRGYFVLAWYSLPNQQWFTDGDNLPLADDFIVAWCEIEEYKPDDE